MKGNVNEIRIATHRLGARAARAGRPPGAVCQSNQPWPHRWTWYAFWYFLFIADLGAADKRWPAVREPSDACSVPLLIGLALALVFAAAGLMIWFRRAYAVGAFTRTVISLTAKAGAQRAKVTPRAAGRIPHPLRGSAVGQDPAPARRTTQRLTALHGIVVRRPAFPFRH